ncbi:hypothetical protein BUALT_Bualt03G0110800 [Buddleja alternifolia]|uniref:Bacterial surface antigen (D15) domain-containing protein n=1 Tax=Buddleja alternifolia TaxID=168488 RepID=A0AAV6XZK7_9LAMI|nr:hypothetical protein BUALT_Bualt03G0110800 [Buddleja alternifolia]
MAFATTSPPPFSSFDVPPPAESSGSGAASNSPPFTKINMSQPSKDWDSHDLPPNMVVQLKKLSGFKKYKVSNINFLNPRTRSIVYSAEESFGDLVDLKPGNVYTKHDFMKQLNALSSSGCFEKIELDAKTNPDGSVNINIPFKEYVYPSKKRFRCVDVGLIPGYEPIENEPESMKENIELQRRMLKQYRKRIERGRECILPEEVEKEIEGMLWKRNSVSSGLLRRIALKIQKWYNDNGYEAALVVGHSHPELNPGGEIIYEVVEGEITKLEVKFKDKLGNVCEGNTNLGVIKRVLPEEVGVGNPYNIGALNRAMNNLQSLNLFSHMAIDRKWDEKNGAMALEILLQEQSQKWAEVNTEWNIVPGPNRLPTLASIKPGATISFEHRNIKGLNRSFNGAITLSNLFEPEDDIGFNFEYTHPYLDGVDDPRNRTFHATCFNSRKLSPVFRGGPGVDDQSSIWVDRGGIKATITEDYTRQSKFSYGIVMEDIRTHDEAGQIASRGHRVLANGEVREGGPPTTLSGTGIDRMPFLQANLTRDTTKFVNGAIVGARDIFQVDQGLGIGSKNAFFNRHKISATRFIPLKKVKEGKGKAGPPSLVLHGLYGGCVGDLPNHEAFTIGGPHSVRGYSMGEIGASRNKLELAAEVRVPVKENAYVYAFAEHGNDLGSSVGVQGNPTKSYMRKGHGSSYGAGIKIGQVRAEYAVDHNAGKGAFFVHFGDRF